MSNSKHNNTTNVQRITRILFIVLLGISIWGFVAKAQSGYSASVNGTVDKAQVKLFGNGQQAFDIFGGSLAVSGGRTIVGSRWADARGAANAGAAYIFSQDVLGRYMEEARLQPQDVAASDEFGNAVAISGDIAVVGAFGHDGDFGRLKLEDSGAVYVYEARADGSWRLQAKLEPSDATAGLAFGRSVALENNTLVIGAAGAGRNNTGAFYVYELDRGEWIEGERINPPNARQGNEIGSAVAISGDAILVSGAGANDAGVAYIYRRRGRGWQAEAGLSSGNNQEQSYFGYAVALDGDIALVGALGDDSAGTDAGASYIFERQSNGDWKPAGKLTAEDASRDDKFGGAVALQNGLAVVAAEQNDSTASDSGAIYLFSRQSEGNWQLLDKVTAVDANRADHFGSAIALEGTKLAVGALRSDDLAENSGAAYVYDIAPLAGSVANISNTALVNSGANLRIAPRDSFTTITRTEVNSAEVNTLGLNTLGLNTLGLNTLGLRASNTGLNTVDDSYVMANAVLAPQLSTVNQSVNQSVNANDTNSFSEIRANNGRSFNNQNTNVQQGQFGEGTFSQSQLNLNQFNQGVGSTGGATRNLGSSLTNQNFNSNQGFGTNQGFGLNQLGGGLNSGLGSSQGLNSGFGNQGFSNSAGMSGTSRNLGTGQGFNQGFNQGLGNQGLNSGQGLNNAPYAAPSSLTANNNFNNNTGFNSGNSGLNSGLNNNLGNNQNANQGEGFLGLGRFFRNPNRQRVEEDGIPRLSTITEQEEAQQNNGFLGLGKLRNLGRNNSNRGNNAGTALNRDTRTNGGFGTSAGQFNQGFGNQGLSQGFGNQGLSQGFGNQSSNQGFGNQGFNNQSSNQSFGNSNIMNLRNQTNRVGDYVELELPLFSTPVIYLSANLPQGLQLDSREGIIFGEIARGSVGDYDVIIQVDDGQNQLTEGFSWRVNR